MITSAEIIVLAAFAIAIAAAVASIKSWRKNKKPLAEQSESKRYGKHQVEIR